MKKNIFIALILIIGFMAGITLYSRPYLKSVEEERRLLAELAEQKEIARELEREIGRQGQDSFIEEIARQRFGYVYPDEIVFYNLAD